MMIDRARSSQISFRVRKYKMLISYVSFLLISHMSCHFSIFIKLMLTSQLNHILQYIVYRAVAIRYALSF